MLTTASTTGISGSAISSGTVPEAYGGTGTSTGYYGFKNRIINGAMVIDQRNAGAAVTGNNDFPVDRFKVNNTTDGAYSGQRDTSAPTGFINSLKITATTADASLAATQRLRIQYAVEGNDVSDFALGTANAKTFTLSFWVRSSLTGTFGGSVQNNDADRSYVFSYSISVANTWEQKSVTIAGDTTGTWVTNTSIGLRVNFGLGVGSDFSGTAGSWTATNNMSATSAVSVIGTLNATWYITGVQLEKGATATSFDYRPYGTELALCQRYYAKINASATYTGFGSGLFASTVSAQVFLKYPTTMRSAPTISQSNCALNTTDVAFTVTSLSGTNAGTDTALQSFSIASGGTQYRAVVLTANNNTSAYVDFSSEL